MTPGEKQAIADAAKLMLEQLSSDRGKTSYWGRRWLDNHADDDIEVWLESVLEVFGAPPIKVGDMVNDENIDELASGSIIAADGGPAWVHDVGMWHFGERTMQRYDVIARGDQRVLRIGGGS